MSKDRTRFSGLPEPSSEAVVATAPKLYSVLLKAVDQALKEARSQAMIDVALNGGASEGDSLEILLSCSQPWVREACMVIREIHGVESAGHTSR